jgi:hypothetical protein
MEGDGMSSRTVRRSRHKRLARIQALTPDKQTKEKAWLLVQLKVEVRRRAPLLKEPSVWALARDPDIQEMLKRLDPTGLLQEDLNRVCAEAIAEVAGQHLVKRKPSLGGLFSPRSGGEKVN